MRTALWIYRGDDPTATGELRRLGVPALMIENARWTSRFVNAADAAGLAGPADVIILPLALVDCLSRLPPDVSPPVLIEVDTQHIGRPDAVLHALANRIAGVVARSDGAARWARRALSGADTPVWLVSDVAARQAELAAAALRFDISRTAETPSDLPDRFELWFAEPGDRVGEDEVEALRQWDRPEAERVVFAPAELRAWLWQAGVRFQGREWSPVALQRAIEASELCVFFGRPSFSQMRRRTHALRLGARVRGRAAATRDIHTPVAVGRRWLNILDDAVRARPNEADTTLILLDLVQDLDLALPVVDELTRRGSAVKIVLSTWLERRSPRVVSEFSERGLATESVSREALIAGEGPALTGIGAVFTPAESSLSAHQRAHVLFRRARELKIPTFSMQHGVESVGLIRTEQDLEDPVLLSDHLFTWSAPGETTRHASPTLRPRLIPVGRSVTPPSAVEDLRGALAGFRSIAAIFENLHWNRYDTAWRRQFLADCLEFASLDPERCVVLKPHHAGLWSTRHTHLFPHWPQNLVLADPTDPFWEPFTAPSLLQIADLVITTPSTVALDAVRAAKPVAIAAYGLDLRSYAPLTLLQSLQDWLTFAAASQSIGEAHKRAAFLARTTLGDHAERRIVDRLTAAMQERARQRAGARIETAA